MSTVPSPQKTRLYITGFMGSGKSTVGPILARALGYAFVDLDAVIEKSEHKTIPEIFREKGEKEFRALERREILSLPARAGLVIATGGGVLTDPESYAVIRSTGTLIYLEVPVDTLVERLRGIAGRPMISAPDGSPLAEEALRERVAALLASREKLYRSADIVLDAAKLAPPAAAEAILRALGTPPAA